MPTVTIELPGYQKVEVDLTRLTPTARALAEIISSAAIPILRPIILESVRTRREMMPPERAEELIAWYSPEELDQVDRIHWDGWADYPKKSTMDVHDVLESEARKLPLGYYPVGLGKDHRVPSADAAKNDTDLIDKSHVLDVLREEGRPISAAAMDNYRSKPPKDWPQPVKYIGRTPLWSERAIRAYAALSHS